MSSQTLERIETPKTIYQQQTYPLLWTIILIEHLCNLLIQKRYFRLRPVLNVPSRQFHCGVHLFGQYSECCLPRFLDKLCELLFGNSIVRVDIIRAEGVFVFSLLFTFDGVVFVTDDLLYAWTEFLLWNFTLFALFLYKYVPYRTQWIIDPLKECL